MTRTEFIARITQTSGKFFSLEFQKKDGTPRRISAQIVEAGDPTPQYLKKHGYVVVRDTNAERSKAKRSEYVAVATHRVISRENA
jgi:hypothetical protein